MPGFLPIGRGLTLLVDSNGTVVQSSVNRATKTIFTGLNAIFIAGHDQVSTDKMFWHMEGYCTTIGWLRVLHGRHDSPQLDQHSVDIIGVTNALHIALETPSTFITVYTDRYSWLATLQNILHQTTGSRKYSGEFYATLFYFLYVIHQLHLQFNPPTIVVTRTGDVEDGVWVEKIDNNTARWHPINIDRTGKLTSKDLVGLPAMTHIEIPALPYAHQDYARCMDLLIDNIDVSFETRVENNSLTFYKSTFYKLTDV